MSGKKFPKDNLKLTRQKLFVQLRKCTKNNSFDHIEILLPTLCFNISLKKNKLFKTLAVELHPQNFKRFYDAYFRVG